MYLQTSVLPPSAPLRSCWLQRKAPKQQRVARQPLCAETRKRQRTAPSEPPEETPAQQASGNFLSDGVNLVNDLLFGAASRLDRGMTTCVACRGTGTCNCSTCQGTGTLSNKKANLNQIKHASNRLQSLMGGGQTHRDTEWMMTNRCRKCHGHGRMPCPACEGRGIRGELL
ncbi:hypothetical protein WJX74_003373 [Apatococcus lobatus]|uniref:Uncharacterized protein n=1 Tax=Apatococcus lobatus TaxID=904363 RepID=A0AAW1QC75_9CHLO